MATQSTHVSSRRASHGSSLLDRQEIRGREPEDLWMNWTWIWLFGAYFLNATLPAAVHRTRQWSEFTKRKESSVEQCRTGIQWNWKTDQWTNRDHWCKEDWFQRTWVDVDKLIVQPSLSVHQRHNLRLLRLCTLCGKNGRWSKCDLLQKIKWYSENNYFKEMNRIDGMPTEFEWMRDLQCEPEHFKDRIIFMSMYNDIAWDEEIQKDVNTIHRQLRNMLVDSLAVIGLSWGLDRKRNGKEPSLIDPTSSAFERGRKWHFDGGDENVELLLRTVISANQLSVYGAVADLFNELSEDFRALVKPKAPDHLDTIAIPTVPSTSEAQTNERQRWNLTQEHDQNSSNCPKNRNYLNNVLKRVWS